MTISLLYTTMNLLSFPIRSTALALTATVQVTVSAQSVFKGRITDNQNQPVGFANILLVNPVDSSFAAGTVSREDGTFTLSGPATVRNYLLKVSSTGYTTVYRPVARPGNLGTIVLTANVVNLKGTTVTAKRPVFSLEKGGITADIEHSVLSHETSANDVLRKLPGLMEKDGKVQTFTGDAPVIYLNGKKVTDYTLVKNLPVKEIKTVRLINNPGAEYEASAKCVLLITTKRNLQGLSAQTDLEGSRNHYNSHNEGMNLSYTTGKVTLFANGKYTDSRMKNIEDDLETNTLEKETYRNKMLAAGKGASKDVDYALGFNYDINENNHWGVEYSGSYDRNYGDSFMNDSTYVNDILHDVVKSPYTMRETGHTSHVNAFYTGTFSEKAGFRLYADYLGTNSDKTNHIDEHSTATGPRIVETSSHSDYKVYAARGIYNYKFNDRHSLTAGAEYSYTDGVSTLRYTDGSNPTDYNNTERRAAVFTEYGFRKNRFSLTAGLRYEFVNSDQTDRLDGSRSLHRDYSNLLPSLSLNYATTKQVSHSLSFRTSVDRPDYSMLANTSNYVNRYMRQVGNPTLQPQTTYSTQYTFLYKQLMLQASYKYIRDFIGYIFTTDEKDPAVAIVTQRNINHSQIFIVTAAYSHKWGCYEPSLSVSFYKNLFKSEYLGKATNNGKPVAMIDWNNGLNLPGGFYLNAEYQYQSGGSIQYLTLRPTHIVNLSLQKSFLKDHLTFTLEGEDLLNKSQQRMHGGYGTVYLNQYQFSDARCASLHITWRFNSENRKSYKGQSAAESEAKRLESK